VSAPAPAESPAIDPRRYRRVRRFFLRAAVHLAWWDIALNTPLLRAFRPDPLPRWRRLAGRYRALAVEMGGVLIKLGQYLSTRVDVLPFEVTRELAGLQDEVPEELFAAILASLEEDLGRPVDAAFAAVDPKVLGAASLAQVHGARLHSGEEVVVKVLRPGIEGLVETDLKAIGVAVRWLKHWRFVRKRVDLDWLMEEFATTTRAELDLTNEGHNAERFAALFADDPGVLVPKIYWQTTGRRTLTEENVAFLKIADVEALEAAGVRPGEVARKMYRVYMEQIFVHSFVHADPHPGNLFVHPLEAPEDPETGRPFQVVFVDFGMAAVIPERLRDALRDFIVGVGTRDAGGVVASLSKAGILLPGADLDELEAAAESIFDRFWGASFEQVNDLARKEAASLFAEFGRLLLETPVQAQADLLFVGRAFELLAGLATSLDSAFDPWTETIPFAKVLASQTVQRDWKALLADLGIQARELVKLPANAAHVLSQARRGRLVLRSSLAPDASRRLRKMERSLRRLQATVLAASLLVAGAVLYQGPRPWWLAAGVMAIGLAGLLWNAWRR
jgi:predicted unusual protein kinase regulating ubiquinone biosynthesis (AarF/ABC1/UbiB family)